MIVIVVVISIIVIWIIVVNEILSYSNRRRDLDMDVIIGVAAAIGSPVIPCLLVAACMCHLLLEDDD